MVSIIVPVYNVENYLEECLKSICSQTYQDIEVIIIDDGSTDSSYHLAKKYEKEDPRLVVIHQENKGLPGARNTGIEHAKGSHIMFVDSDDVIEPNMCELMINKIICLDADLVVCNYCQFGTTHAFPSLRYQNALIQFNRENIYEFFSLCLDSSCNKIYKRLIIEQNHLRFESKSLVPQEDFYFLLKYLCYSEKVATVCNSLYRYRIRLSSISKQTQEADFLQGCLRFVELAEQYMLHHWHTKEIEEFIQFLLVEMLFSAINNSHPPKHDVISKVIVFFAGSKLYIPSIEIKRKFYRERRFKDTRSFYFWFIFTLLSNHAFKTVSILESTRIRRLRKRLQVNNAYD